MTDDRPSRMTVRRYSSPAEADRHDLEFWLQIPDAAFIDLLPAFIAADVRFLIVGAYALARPAEGSRAGSHAAATRMGFTAIDPSTRRIVNVKPGKWRQPGNESRIPDSSRVRPAFRKRLTSFV